MRFCATDYTGLDPKAWLVVGPEFSREEAKGLLLEAGPLTGQAVHSPLGLASHVIELVRGKKPVTVTRSVTMSFFESISRSLKTPDLSTRRLMRSVVSARNWAAHPGQEDAFLERLAELGFPSTRRDLIAQVRAAWVQWLVDVDLYDEARIYEEATEHVAAGSGALSKLPDRLDVWRFGLGDAREEYFFDALKSRVEMTSGLPDLEPATDRTDEEIQSSNLGAALEGLVAKISDDSAIVFQDQPRVRREIARVFGTRLLEVRDPTLARGRELLKASRALPLAQRERCLREFKDAPPEDLELLVRAWRDLDACEEYLPGAAHAWARHIEALAPPPSPLTPRSGLTLVRYGRVTVRPCRELVLLPDSSDEAVFASDDWLSSAEREQLSMFGVRTRRGTLLERQAATEWMSLRAKKVIRVGLEGERATRADRLSPRSTEVRLAPLASARVRASDVDAQSQCGFLGLVRGRWRLDDPTPSDALDSSPSKKGIVLHEAAHALVARIEALGFLEFESARVLELDQVVRDVLAPVARLWELPRWREVLDEFLDRELEVRKRLGLRTVGAEVPLELKAATATVYGRADRIDESADGHLLVIDYKTGGEQPHGDQMVGGYHLQLPFYALAARGTLAKEVVGAQFIELKATPQRSRGVFHKQYVGSKPPAVATIRANSRSLRSEPLGELWGGLQKQIESTVGGYTSGVYDAKPKDPDDCPRCPASHACGASRQKMTQKSL